MRKIITSDVFKMARIIKKANAKEEIKTIFDQIADNKEDANIQKQIGIEFIAFLIDACGDEEVEKMLYGLLAGIAEKKENDIKNQSFDETMEMLKEIAKENDLQNFFGVAVKSA